MMNMYLNFTINEGRPDGARLRVLPTFFYHNCRSYGAKIPAVCALQTNVFGMNF